MALGRGYADYHRRRVEQMDVSVDVAEVFAESLMQEKEKREQRIINFLTWAMRVPEPKTGTLDFSRYPFQRELYEQGQADKEIVIQKSTQVGVSAYLVRWTLFWADVRGLVALYVFPKEKQLLNFSDARIRPLVLNSDYLRGRVPAVHVQNKGLKQVGLGFCMGEGTQVLCEDGLRPIESVRPGERVWTHRGRWRRVECIHARMANTVEVYATGATPAIRATAEHPFYTRERVNVKGGPWAAGDFAWTEAHALAHGNHLLVGVELPVPQRSGRSPDWWWCIGRYLADGWSGGSSGGYLSCRDDKLAEVCRRLGAAGVGYTVEKLPQDGKSTRVTLRHTEFKREAKRFGRSAATKALTWEALRLPHDEAGALLEGYLAGDGSRGEKGWHVTTVSRALAVGISLIIRRVTGLVPACAYLPARTVKVMGRDVEARAAYTLRIPRGEAIRGGRALADGSTVMPVRKVAPGARERVWNLQVEEDESFAADGVIVHNCYYRGSESKESLDSVDADVLALDEYDTLKQENVPDAERRLSGSSVALIRRVGVPSIPDWGINRLYGESDRRQWHVRCSWCHEWQPITFRENVAWGQGGHDDRQRFAPGDDPYICCRDCARPLDVTKGEWVAEFPDRSIRGYKIPRLIVPHADLKSIVEAAKAREPYKVQVHQNKDLGEAYASDEHRLSPQALAAAERPYGMVEAFVPDGRLVTMGVDVASARALNVRVSLHNDVTHGRPTKGALWIGTVDTFDDLPALMERYGVMMCAIDHMPEHRLARSFAERYAGRVYLVRYTGGQAVKVLDVDEDLRVATVRRTEAIDAAITMVREQRNHLPLDRPSEYNQHMMSVVRFTETDDLGKLTVGYRSTGPDDYLHAEVFDLVAGELWNVRQHVVESQREQLTPLDDMLEFRRSAIHQDVDDATYSEGYRIALEDYRDPGLEYSPGPGDD